MKTKISFVALLAAIVLTTMSCTKQPMACTDGDTKTGTTGQAVSFSAACSMDAHHYEWEFGDGGTGSGATVTHVYNSKGSYTAKIKAMSKNMKKEDEKTISVTIN